MFLRFYNNILFLISISWSLLCDFNTKMFYLCPCGRSQCAFLQWLHRRNVYFTLFWSYLMHCSPQWQNFTDENLALHVMMVEMLDVEFYRLYNGVWACDLMQCLCRVFAVIFVIFTKVCRVFFAIFCRDFLLSLVLCKCNINKLRFLQFTFKVNLISTYRTTE